jgi:hypothetical protein
MHRGLWLFAVLLALAGVSPAQAQRRSIFFGGVDPTNLTFVPVDTSQSVVPIAQPVTRSTGFRLVDLLPRIPLPGARPVIGRSTFPAESQLPGLDYLKAFQYRPPRPLSE